MAQVSSMARRDRRGWRRRLHAVRPLLLMGLGSALVAACMSTTAYQPNTHKRRELGSEQAHQQLEAILRRSVNPPISAVEVTDTFVRVDLANTTYQVRVFFRDIQRAEVFTNHLVVLRAAEDRILFRPVLANAQDAQTFADLMLSWAGP